MSSIEEIDKEIEQIKTEYKKRLDDLEKEKRLKKVTIITDRFYKKIVDVVNSPTFKNDLVACLMPPEIQLDWNFQLCLRVIRPMEDKYSMPYYQDYGLTEVL